MILHVCTPAIEQLCRATEACALTQGPEILACGASFVAETGKIDVYLMVVHSSSKADRATWAHYLKSRLQDRAGKISVVPGVGR